MNMIKVKHFIISYTVLLTVLVHRRNAYATQDTGGFLLDTIFPVAFCILFLVTWLWAFIDILKNEFSGYNKEIWLLVVRAVPVFGFILYFLLGRKQKYR